MIIDPDRHNPSPRNRRRPVRHDASIANSEGHRLREQYDGVTGSNWTQLLESDGSEPPRERTIAHTAEPMN